MASQVSRRILEEISEGGHRLIDTTRPTLGFPLGTALVLVVVFGISALFSCCYHWEKIRSLQGREQQNSEVNSPDMASAPRGHTITPNLPPPTEAPPPKNSRLRQSRSLPVIMPGDDVPKFLACPAPRN